MKSSTLLLLTAAILTAASLAGWVATGSHPYTKFKVVEEIDVEIDRDDPLAETGFYDGVTMKRTQEREEFHLGLFPTPRGLFDKHLISVMTTILPVWVLFGWVAWRRGRSRATARGRPAG